MLSISKILSQTCYKLTKSIAKGINIYYTGYIIIKKTDDYENIDNLNPLCLSVNHASGYIEEKNGNKYLIFDVSTEELLKSY